MCRVVSRADPPEKPLSQSYLSWGDMVEAIAQEGHGAADRDKVLTAADYQQAEMTIFQIVQVEFFPEKIRLLKAGKAEVVVFLLCPPNLTLARESYRLGEDFSTLKG